MKCPSTVVTNPRDDGVIIKEPTSHTHLGDSATSQAKAVKAQMKDAARASLEPTRLVIANHTGKFLRFSNLHFYHCYNVLR